MKTADEVYQDIYDYFVEKTNNEPGAVLDLFTNGIATEISTVHQTIENNKTPHIFTKLEGSDLDDTGTWVNLPRDVGETDNSYKYRLMKWTQLHEAANETAISTALLNPDYAANIEFVPLTNGAGTGTCYVIPKEYTEDSITAALEEAEERINSVASCTAYIDYIVPEMQSVSFEIYLSTSNGDETAIKEEITDNIRSYVNDIAPHNYLSIGEINKMGVNTSGVDYFNVLSLIINGSQTSGINVLQETDTKFIFDNITWIGDSEDDV